MSETTLHIDQIFETINETDIIHIIDKVKELYNFNLEYFSPIYLNRRIVYSMQKMKVVNVGEYIKRLESIDFFEQLLFDLTNDGVEFFRDSHVWKRLINHLNEHFSKNDTLKIWFPDFAGGEDLYSFLIILNIKKLLSRCLIIASGYSENRAISIKNGVYLKPMNETIQNFKNTGMETASEYFKSMETAIQLQSELTDNVTFINLRQQPLHYNQAFDIVFYRNSMITLRKEYQQQIEDKIYDSLKIGGYLYIGVNERLMNIPTEIQYKTIDEELRIYQKK